MKFLCDSCKATYQIADEKVAGKTLRMKCRKCGHEIVMHSAGPDAIPTPPSPPINDAARTPTAGLGTEWHVSIDDEPVGPMHLSELLARAAKGEVTGESLCWREGLDDWRLVREVPELSALLRAADEGDTPPKAKPTPPPLPPSTTPRRLADEQSGRLAPPATLRLPSAPPPVAPPQAIPSLTAPARPMTEAAPKTGVPISVFVGVVLALGAGIVLLLVRSRHPSAPVATPATSTTVTATAPASSATTTVAEAPTAAIPAPASSLPSDSKPKAVPAVAKASGPKPAETEKRGLDLSNLVGGGGGGPTTGPKVAPSGGGGGASLDQAAVERVVADRRAGVRRTCWERNTASQRSSVNVTVTATVAPNGQVTNTSATGDDPMVARCIENQVRTWQFPAPGAATTVNIPFKFVRQ